MQAKTEDSPNVSIISVFTIIYIAIPAAGHNTIDSEQFGMKCKFGRFGPSIATYINKTTILCLTPNIQEDPSDISEETVEVTVALNGIDFNDDYSSVEFVFVGTGGSISTWVIIMGTLIFGLLIVSVLIFLGGLQEWIKVKRELKSNVVSGQDGRLQPRALSRGSANQTVPRFNLSRAGGSRAGSSRGPGSSA